MNRLLAAAMVASACASSLPAQTGTSSVISESAAVLSLEQAVASAGGAAPETEAAGAAVDAARANRSVAGLRPNPVAQGQIENVAGSGTYRGLRSAETTVGLAFPIERGGKRRARVAVADAQLSRAEIEAAIAAVDIRLQVTQLYVEAVAAERRVAAAQDQARIAAEALNAARVRVRAGRASPLEAQRADVGRINAEANLTRTRRLAEAARANLERRIGQPVVGLDGAVLDRLPAADAQGPILPANPAGTLALASAEADVLVADAGVRLARANRVPDLNIGPAVRRLEATNDLAAVFTVSMPIPLFSKGGAAIAQATAQRTQADAVRRVRALNVEQAIVDAQAQADNAATTARTAAGPALEAAQEAARIARIGYREGKFGQLDLLDAERSLAETRLAAIDALATYQIARAQLERLTARAPKGDMH
ncbi:TolC family protein [Sphingomonas sp. TDK1]|uniref:TolC family protein n=1 Tax=Sphingomonas sp. TDK1 TaxID=453247 RepID=UPI0007D9D2F7|nr:TolC family protein [Sphingomonas sp. TDK1]OAN66724.1 transporter [Sphingomonas sp. TDK1]